MTIWFGLIGLRKFIERGRVFLNQNFTILTKSSPFELKKKRKEMVLGGERHKKGRKNTYLLYF